MSVTVTAKVYYNDTAVHKGTGRTLGRLSDHPQGMWGQMDIGPGFSRGYQEGDDLLHVTDFEVPPFDSDPFEICEHVWNLCDGREMAAHLENYRYMMMPGDIVVIGEVAYACTEGHLGWSPVDISKSDIKE